MARETKNAPLSAALEKVKAEFRRWYGMVSPEEIVGNRDVIEEIARLERMLARTGGA